MVKFLPSGSGKFSKRFIPIVFGSVYWPIVVPSRWSAIRCVLGEASISWDVHANRKEVWWSAFKFAQLWLRVSMVTWAFAPLCPSHLEISVVYCVWVPFLFMWHLNPNLAIFLKRYSSLVGKDDIIFLYVQEVDIKACVFLSVFLPIMTSNAAR